MNEHIRAAKHVQFRVTVPDWVRDVEPVATRFLNARLERHSVPPFLDEHIFGGRVQRSVEADLLVGQPASAEPLPLELVIRELIELDLSEPSELLEFSSAFGFAGDNWFGYSPQEGGEERGVPLEIVVLDLASLRAKAMHWIIHKKGGDIQNAYDDRQVPAIDRWEDLASALDYGLEPFRPRIRVTNDEGFDTRSVGSRPAAPVAVTHGLTLQLAQLMEEDPRLKVCPVCQGWWVRQRGRAKQGQYRTKGGVKYCSSRCASTQASRDARRRAAEE